jgi:hypothetical protein
LAKAIESSFVQTGYVETADFCCERAIFAMHYFPAGFKQHAILHRIVKHGSHAH